ASTVDQVLKYHSDFLDTCLKECMLTNAKLLRIYSKLLYTCVLFANYTEKFTKSLVSLETQVESMTTIIQMDYQDRTLQLNNHCNEITEFQEELAKEKIRNQQLVNDNYLLRRENEANIKLVHSLQQYIKNNK
ncbi:9165_t:CDS:2, partial [Entrophospora sp. SA101]